MSLEDLLKSDDVCKHCGDPIAIRNPAGDCDHLYWPDLLTDEAKIANGFQRVTRTVTEWSSAPKADVGGEA